MSTSARSRPSARSPSASPTRAAPVEDDLSIMDTYSGGGKIKHPRTYRVEFEPLKLMFALVLTMYFTTILLPPANALPGDDTGSTVRDGLINDTGITVMIALGLAGVALLLGAVIVPLHDPELIERWTPGIISRAIDIKAVVHALAKLRGAVLGYRPSNVSMLYQPMNANEFLASILCLSAVYLRSWSFAVLDHHFTYAVRILEGHRLVGTAPYSVLIHPSYTGLVLASIGYIWFMGFRRLQFLGFVCFMIAATVMRIRDEEQVLAQHFGAEWDAHIKGKSRLIPHVW